MGGGKGNCKAVECHINFKEAWGQAGQLQPKGGAQFHHEEGRTAAYEPWHSERPVA